MHKAGRIVAAVAVTATAALGLSVAPAYAGSNGPQIESPDEGASVWFRHYGDKLYVFDQLGDGKSAVGTWRSRDPDSWGSVTLCNPVWNARGHGYQVSGKCKYNGKYNDHPEGWNLEYHSCTGSYSGREVGECSAAAAAVP
ncbi:hypothetical protein K378_00537 [Streptomyces sp. Amel2xB2]|nr:hypothetical protein K378_00537 [Streptomyces sp. Amel2xB2]